MSTASTFEVEPILALLRDLFTQGRIDDALAQVASLLTQMQDQNNTLQLRLGKLLRYQFGRKSEKVSVEQLSLFLSRLSQQGLAAPTPAVQPAPQAPAAAAEGEGQVAPPKPSPRRGHGRKPLPPSLPREEHILSPPEKERTCPTCKTTKSRIGFERSEMLEFVPSSFKVIVNAREKLACRTCGEGVAIGPVADKVIDNGLPGPGLLAQIVVSKYKEHQPLTRQAEIYKRSGVELSTSTLADWVGAATDALEPLAVAIREQALVSHILQSDDTGLKVLDRDHPDGIKRGHIWLYVGDAKWAAFTYTPDWKASGPQGVLANRVGWLVVDAYAGYEALFTGERATAIEVGCWSHVRRKFVEALEGGDVRAAVPIDLIGKLFAVERKASEDAVEPAERLARRNRDSRPVIEQLGRWMADTHSREPPKSPLARAIGYAIRQWQALTRFLEDGRLPLENNLSERLLRPIALGRKNYLFAGSDRGAERAAIAYTLLGTCALNGVEPWAYLHDILSKLAANWPNDRLHELLPPFWAAHHQAKQEPHAAPATALIT